MFNYKNIFDLTGKTALIIGPTYEGIGHAQAAGATWAWHRGHPCVLLDFLRLG